MCVHLLSSHLLVLLSVKLLKLFRSVMVFRPRQGLSKKPSPQPQAFPLFCFSQFFFAPAHCFLFVNPRIVLCHWVTSELYPAMADFILVGYSARLCSFQSPFPPAFVLLGLGFFVWFALGVFWVFLVLSFNPLICFPILTSLFLETPPCLKKCIKKCAGPQMIPGSLPCHLFCFIELFL